MEDKDEETRTYSSINGEHNIVAMSNDKEMTISIMDGNGLQFYKLNRGLNRDN